MRKLEILTETQAFDHSIARGEIDSAIWILPIETPQPNFYAALPFTATSNEKFGIWTDGSCTNPVIVKGMVNCVNNERFVMLTVPDVD